MSFRVQYFGGPYPDTVRYYWLDTRFPCCAGPLLGPIPITTAEFLDNNNVVLCQWDPEPGATGYLLLQTEAPTVPAAGEYCVVARTGATSYTDSGAVLNQYPDPAEVVKRPKAGQTFEVSVQTPTPRPDRRQNHPDALRDKAELKAKTAETHAPKK